MNCDETRRHWSLYHDSEGAMELHFELNEHLGSCPDCARWFHEQSRLEDLIAEKLRPDQPNAALWRAVLSRGGLKRSPSIRPLLIAGGVVALAACLLVAAGIWYLPGDSQADLAKLTASWHVELVGGRKTVEFASRSDLEIERYLRRQVSFPVRCPPRKDAGFLVAGAGVCRLADSQAAYLLGSVGGKPVSIFILPRENLVHFPHQHAAVRREGTHRCREGVYEMVMAEIDRTVILVIGQGSADRLLRVLNAYGTYPEVESRESRVESILEAPLSTLHSQLWTLNSSLFTLHS